MRRFNRGAALAFLLILLVAILAVRWTYQRVAGRYQAELAVYAAYTVDDWLEFFRLEELLGDPPVTPIPVDELLATATATATAPAAAPAAPTATPAP